MKYWYVNSLLTLSLSQVCSNTRVSLVHCLDRRDTHDAEFEAAWKRANPNYGGSLHYDRTFVWSLSLPICIALYVPFVPETQILALTHGQCRSKIEIVMLTPQPRQNATFATPSNSTPLPSRSRLKNSA